MMTQEQLSARLWDLAVVVGKLVDALPDSRLGRHVAGQLVRSGTASAPSHDESGAAESRGDAIHKLSIALKELRETRGWLRFILKSELLPSATVSGMLDECEQLCRILERSVAAAQGDRKAAPGNHDHSQKPGGRFPDFLSRLDHVAIAVSDTEAALRIWRDTLGFPLRYSEEVNGGTVRLTHLDLGNADLQLVQPLTPDHPLQKWLAEHGPGLHHFCLEADDLDQAMAAAPVPTAPNPHQGTQGKRALFLDKTATQGVQVELTGR